MRRASFFVFAGRIVFFLYLFFCRFVVYFFVFIANVPVHEITKFYQINSKLCECVKWNEWKPLNSGENFFNNKYVQWNYQRQRNKNHWIFIVLICLLLLSTSFSSPVPFLSASSLLLSLPLYLSPPLSPSFYLRLALTLILSTVSISDAPLSRLLSPAFLSRSSTSSRLLLCATQKSSRILIVKSRCDSLMKLGLLVIFISISVNELHSATIVTY